ncbi:hypothetical protein RDWZM_008289 [Blomia tropicalis]|uniref:Uncharacterized protein n=1 Tax=Blomia tropicalis TaxID=40697 RepID=A0A9Q0M1H3_BLOTA|nr:hypothetical protein RDWZM_008289 [Blomia tropicalis]
MNDSQENIINDNKNDHESSKDEDSDSNSSTIVDVPLEIIKPRSSTAWTEPAGDSIPSLSRKESSKSKISGFKAIRDVTTRIKVANQLSIAKRAQRDDVSVIGSIVPDDPTPTCVITKPDFGSKLNLPLSNSKPINSNLSSPSNEDNQNEYIISGGDLVFDNDYNVTNNLVRPYIQVMSEVEASDVGKIMAGEWNLPLPRIAVFMISNVGELSYWNSSRQIAAFKKGLIKAANTTCMWLFTNGLNTGIGKLIGEAIDKEQKEKRAFRYYEKKNEINPFNLIGVVNDFNLAYPQQFFGKTIRLGSVGSNISENRYELEPNHTHFVVLNSINSENASNIVLLNLIDYFTKNIAKTADVEDRGNPFVQLNSSKTEYSTYNSNHEKSVPPIVIPPTPSMVSLNVPTSGGQTYKGLDQLVVDDIDYLTTPDTSGVPPLAVGTSVSRQISSNTLLPDSAEPRSKKPSFVQENLSTDPLHITEHFASCALDSSVEPEKTHKSILDTTIVPVVCLVIQGGYECAKMVLDNLRRRNPVIVLRGTGGFADLLSYAFLEMQQRCRDLFQSWDAEFVEHTLKPLLALKIVKRFPQFRNNALARNMFRDRIIECVRESGSPKGQVFLSILNMHNSSCDLENLSEYILLSLFKSQNRREALDSNLIRRDLYLTIDWNCSHVALDEVLRRNPLYNLQLEKGTFEMALIQENREDFVDLFLSHGFKIHKFLTPYRLRRLLLFSLSESDFFRTVCMENILGIPVWSAIFEELTIKLSAQLEDSSSDIDNFAKNEFNQLILTCTSLNNFLDVEQLHLNIMALYKIDAESTERRTLAILAMWAIFNQRVKLAQILWKHSDQPIHLGLILSMMLDRLVWFVSEQNIKDELTNHSKTFEQYSIGVLDICYRQDEKRSYDLLNQENSDWEQKTAVDIAADGRSRGFIAHPCCQKWLTTTFNGKIRVRELTWGFITISPVIKIILSAYLIFPMYIWIRFIDGQRAKPTLTKSNFKTRDEQESEHEDEASSVNHILMENFNRELKETEFSSSKAINHKEFIKDKKKNRNTSKKDTFHQRYLIIQSQPPLRKMIYLMWNSPITKFWTFQVFYIFYLAIFSLAVIWPGCGNWYLDTLVCLWTFLNLIEHIGRTCVLFHRYTSVPMFFKIFEIVALIILLVVYSLGRVFTFNNHSFVRIFDPYTMKVVLCIGLLYFYYRLFAIHLPISATLGPLLYRFKLMITVDFIHFMRMALILLISSGIVIQAVLYPNTELSLDTFHKAFHRSAISLFTTPVEELTVKCNRTNLMKEVLKNQNSSTIIDRKFIFNMLPDHCPANPIPMNESCPQSGFWPYIFTFQFLIFLKLILMTLLYALFASTASKLQSDTDSIWKFQRYTLVIDFANRPPLHAPLSIFLYCYKVIQIIFRIITCQSFKCGFDFKDDVDNNVFISSENKEQNGVRLSQEDYNFWRHLAKKYYDDEQKKNDKNEAVARQSDTVQMICEEMEHNKHMLRSLKGKISEMERLLQQTQIHLDGMKHSSHSNTMAPVDLPLSVSEGIHYLSRHSPYVGTRIQRFPIADKYVSWDVIWINYDPVIYSRKREDFSVKLKEFVDEDILAIKERLNSVISDVSSKQFHLPVFNWNAVSVNPAGLTIDRRSWLTGGVNQNSENSSNRIIYKLDDGIPLNPFGRTGLRGKGNLPCWGPNHYIMVIMTRSNNNSSCSVLEFALELKTTVLSIPMRFVGNDKPFSEISQLIVKEGYNQEWSNQQDMMSYFEKRIADGPPNMISIRHEPDTMHYMDSPDNTDNAWKELHLFHIHFDCNGPTILTDNLLRSSNKGSIGGDQSGQSQGTLIWHMSNEDLLVRIPMEQVSFMNSIMRRFQSKHQHQQ